MASIPLNSSVSFGDENSFVKEESPLDVLRPRAASESLFNCCTKFYPDGGGGWYPVKRIIFDRQIYNPGKMEKHIREEAAGILVPEPEKDSPKNRNPEETIWKKSYNRARQQCYDYLMCNPDLNLFLTFTVDPSRYDSHSYAEIVSFLSTWLSNRVRRQGLKYILVPERHKSGAIHFHGICNLKGMRLVSSGYSKVGKYTLSNKEIALGLRKGSQEIFNVEDLPLGFSTAIPIIGENAQEKVAKYIWKYMTKQGGQKIGGRFYLHGGDLLTPKLVFSNELMEEEEGVLVSYGGATCKIVTLNS